MPTPATRPAKAVDVYFGGNLLWNRIGPGMVGIVTAVVGFVAGLPVAAWIPLALIATAAGLAVSLFVREHVARTPPPAPAPPPSPSRIGIRYQGESKGSVRRSRIRNMDVGVDVGDSADVDIEDPDIE